jgi:hypothetical protein
LVKPQRELKNSTPTSKIKFALELKFEATVRGRDHVHLYDATSKKKIKYALELNSKSMVVVRNNIHEYQYIPWFIKTCTNTSRPGTSIRRIEARHQSSNE